MKLRKILFVLAIAYCLVAQEIVDYTHTASIQKTQLNSNKKYEINIAPNKLDPYSF